MLKTFPTEQCFHDEAENSDTVWTVKPTQKGNVEMWIKSNKLIIHLINNISEESSLRKLSEIWEVYMDQGVLTVLFIIVKS